MPIVQSLEDLEVQPASPLDGALTDLCGGARVKVEPDDDVMVIHFHSTGEIDVFVPQLRLLSPGMMERALAKVYRAIVMARAGVKIPRGGEQDTDEEVDESFQLVGPLDETSNEGKLSEAVVDGVAAVEGDDA
jgi:hypothetical protein